MARKAEPPRRQGIAGQPEALLVAQLRVLPPNLVECLVVHELAHLTHKDHSPDFWALVAKAMPDAQHRRRRLREAGQALPL